jgi:hypothetical protein
MAERQLGISRAYTTRQEMLNALLPELEPGQHLTYMGCCGNCHGVFNTGGENSPRVSTSGPNLGGVICPSCDYLNPTNKHYRQTSRQPISKSSD